MAGPAPPTVALPVLTMPAEPFAVIGRFPPARAAAPAAFLVVSHHRYPLRTLATVQLQGASLAPQRTFDLSS